MSQWASDIVKDINDSVTCQDLKNIEAKIQKILAQQEAQLEVMLKNLEKYLPLLSLPSVNPAEIVSYLSKLISGTVAPFVTAYESTIAEVAKVTADVNEIADALTNKISEMESCVSNFDPSALIPNQTLVDNANATLKSAQDQLAANEAQYPTTSSTTTST